MSKSRHTEAQMIGALKQLEAGRKAEDVAREVGVSTEENLRQLGCYVEQHGRPVSVYTDKASCVFSMHVADAKKVTPVFPIDRSGKLSEILRCELKDLHRIELYE